MASSIEILMRDLIRVIDFHRKEGVLSFAEILGCLTIVVNQLLKEVNDE